MKTIAIHSHKGGVGKTTLALILAKYTAQIKGMSVTVIDYDFLGAGMADLIRLTKTPTKYLEDYLLGDFDEYPLNQITAAYTDRDIKPNTISILLNHVVGYSRDSDRILNEMTEDMHAMIGDDIQHPIIEAKTQYLLDKIAEKKPDLVIIDCHPGLAYVSKTITEIVDLNVYVITQHRAGSFGFLKQFNAFGMKETKIFLLLNMASDFDIDSIQWRDLMENDGVLTPHSKTLFGRFKKIGRDNSIFCAIKDDAEIFKGFANIGGSGLIPKIDQRQNLFNYCPKILNALKL